MLGALLILAQGNALIRFEGQTTSLSDLLRQVAERSHRKVSATPELNGEIVGISCDELPSDQLLTQLAYALDARVRGVNGGKELYRESEDVKGREKRERQNRIATIRSLIDTKSTNAPTADDLKGLAARVGEQWKRIDAPQSPTDVNDAWRKLQAMGSEVPAGRIAHRALAALTDDDLAAFAPNARIVFASHPNSLQKPLPKGFDKIIAQFRSEQEQYVNAVAPYAAERKVKFVLPGVATELIQNAPEPAEIYMVVEARSPGTSWLCTVHGLDASGEELFTGVANLAAVGNADNPETGPGVFVEMSASDWPLLKAINDQFRSQPVLIEDDTRKRIGGLKEPLDLLLRPILPVLQAQVKRNILVVGDDALAMATFRHWNAPKSMLARFENDLGAGSRETVDHEGWRIYRSRFPLSARWDTADRVLLTRIMKGALDSGSLSLREYAKFVTAQPKAETLDFATLILRSLAFNATRQDIPLPAYRIFDALAPKEQAGTALLSSAIRSEADRLALGMQNGFVTSGQRGGPALKFKESEPTILWAKLDSKAAFQIQFKASDAITRWVPGGNGLRDVAPLIVSPDYLAIDMSPRRRSIPRAAPEVWRYAQSSDKTWSFALPFSPQVELGFSLVERISNPSRFITFDELPKDFRDKVQEFKSRIPPPR